jgi:hypothetical protein
MLVLTFWLEDFVVEFAESDVDDVDTEGKMVFERGQNIVENRRGGRSPPTT